jgi:outer membrane protein assembly factor BamB
MHKKSIIVKVSFLTVVLCLISVPIIDGCENGPTNDFMVDENSTREYNIYTLGAPYVVRPEVDMSEAGGESHRFPSTSFPFRMTAREMITGGRLDLMDSPWPMYCHDVRHTGRSPYSTVNTTGVESWRISVDGPACGGPTIDKNGTIYIGSHYLHAVYPNGTLKWKNLVARIESAPAIDETGTIYFGSAATSEGFYALYPNGTVKWTYSVAGGNFFSSPAIGPDGTIYVGTGDAKSIHALYPNGTLKWVFYTNHVVYSSPAIGDDGIVYCGSHDTYLYALYPNNGTLKWKYQTGNWIRVSPCIGDDGTIFVVSLDGYLHAVLPNGTMKWKTNVGAGTSPIYGWNDTIYCGSGSLFAVNAVNGSVKWTYPTPGNIEGGTPCQSADGTIYLGAGGSIVAVNPDGTGKWQKYIGQYVDSPPAIGADGTVYIGTWGHQSDFLHAFGVGPLNAHANGPYSGYYQEPIEFNGEAYGGIPPYTFHWDLGDGNTSSEQNPSHSYSAVGTYEAVLTVTDAEGNHSIDNATVTVRYRSPVVYITHPDEVGIYLFNVRILRFLSVTKCIAFGRITIEVNATQWPLGINRVEFLIDGELKATDTEPPYSWTWIGSPRFGDHEIFVRAIDNNGQSSWDRVYTYRFF